MSWVPGKSSSLRQSHLSFTECSRLCFLCLPGLCHRQVRVLLSASMFSSHVSCRFGVTDHDTEWTKVLWLVSRLSDDILVLNKSRCWAF